MALLILFGFIAGAATAVSPCVLPVLPVALSAGRHRWPSPADRHRRRADRFLHVRDRRARLRDRRPWPARRPGPRPRDHRPARLRHHAARPGAVDPVRGLPQPVDQPSAEVAAPATDSGRACGRRQPRPRLRALCRTDPRRGHHRLGIAALHRRTLAVALAYGLGSALVLYLLMIGGRQLVGPLGKRVPQFAIWAGSWSCSPC